MYGLEASRPRGLLEKPAFRARQLPARVRNCGVRGFGRKTAETAFPTKYAPVIYDLGFLAKGQKAASSPPSYR